MTDTTAALAAEIEAALALLDEYAETAADQPVHDSFPSLLAQCEAMCAGLAEPEPVRTLHHFACTGGTLISKCIAALPGVVLLSEIDPLSTLMLPDRTKRNPLPFAPRDLFTGFLLSARDIDQAVIAEGFRAAVEATASALARQGMHLVIRDHSHSQFCTRVDPAARPTVREMLSRGRPPVSAVTVRHPLDSFVSLSLQSWSRFSPHTLEEYSRRYMAFLDRHADLPILKYEDFVADPAQGLRALCDTLRLPFDPAALDLFRIIRISGDSGRSGFEIAPRPRRDLSPEIAAGRDTGAYQALCARLGYEP
jgi:hypothetical protein